MSRFKQLARARAMALRMAKQEELKVLQAMHRRAISQGTPVTFEATVTGQGSTTNHITINVNGVDIPVDVPVELRYATSVIGDPDGPDIGHKIQVEYYLGKMIAKHRLSTS